MTFHTTTAPRIREIAGTVSVEHRATLHYSDSRYFTGDIVTLDLDKNVEEVM